MSVNKNNKKKKNKKPVSFEVVLGFIWGMLIIITLGITVSVHTNRTGYMIDLNTFADSLAEGNYAQVHEYAMQNLCKNSSVNNREENQLVYSVADYFEAASFYKMCLETGDSERAEKYLALMNEAKENTGYLDYAISDINSRFGIE